METAIQEVAEQFPTYGTRRVRHQLRRAPYKMPVKRSKKRTTDSQHPYPRYPNRVKDLAIPFPDQVRVSDMT